MGRGPCLLLPRSRDVIFNGRGRSRRLFPGAPRRFGRGSQCYRPAGPPEPAGAPSLLPGAQWRLTPSIAPGRDAAASPAPAEQCNPPAVQPHFGHRQPGPWRWVGFIGEGTIAAFLCEQQMRYRSAAASSAGLHPRRASSKAWLLWRAPAGGISSRAGEQMDLFPPEFRAGRVPQISSSGEITPQFICRYSRSISSRVPRALLKPAESRSPLRQGPVRGQGPRSLSFPARWSPATHPQDVGRSEAFSVLEALLQPLASRPACPWPPTATCTVSPCLVTPCVPSLLRAVGQGCCRGAWGGVTVLAPAVLPRSRCRSQDPALQSIPALPPRLNEASLI